jgi:hypothetical protein
MTNFKLTESQYSETIFLRGTYELEETLILPNIPNIIFVGGPNCKIKWTGSPGQPMIIISGGFSHIFENIRFDGNNIAGKIFTQRYATRPALGSGKHLWSNCTFMNAEVGIQQGEETLDYNCDLARITNCHFTNLESAIRVVNNQSVGNSVRDSRFIDCKTVFDLLSGSVQCDGAVIHSCGTLLHMKNQGPGNCRIDLRGLHIDNIQKPDFKLIHHDTPRYPRMITLDGILGPMLCSKPMLSNTNFDGTKLQGW